MNTPFSQSNTINPLSGLIVPPMWTKRLIITSVVLFIADIISTHFGFSLKTLLGLSVPTFVNELHVWQFVTFPLVNSGVLTLIFNLLVIWLFGSEIETTLGSKNYLRLLLTSTVFTGAVFVLISFFSKTNVLLSGSEGICFALLTAYGVMFPERIITMLLLLLFPLQIKAKYLVMIFGTATLLMSIGGAGIHNLAFLAACPAILTIMRPGKIPVFSQPQQYSSQGTFPAGVPQKNKSKKKTRAAFFQEDIDPILDKISKQGFQSLTSREKRILSKAKDIIRPGE